MNRYLPDFDNCLQHEKAFCTSECPVHLEVYDFIDRIREGRFNAAYKAFRNAAGFPAIAAQMCSEPCKNVCPLNTKDSEAIELNMLEKACLEYADKKDPTQYNLPMRKKKIAIIGAGISGMACAMRLATKRFAVTVYEKSDAIGGTLKNIMDPLIYENDFSLQMKYLEYELKTNCEINDLDEVLKEGYDAVYIATGKDGNDFSVSMDEGGNPCMQKGDTGVFAGGGLFGHEKIYALGDGLSVATAIDNFLMTKNIIYPKHLETKMVLDNSRITPGVSVKPAEKTAGGNPVYSKEEAVCESKRCLRCQCDSCQIYCDLTEYVHKWPLRIRDEIIATTAPGSADIKATPAKRLINTCTLCGLCKDSCPVSIDLGGLILAARSRMHKLGKMPWVFNDFFLRDMDFSNSEKAYICKGMPGSDKEDCTYAFFPGCQLGASDPDIVIDSYKYILKHEKITGIMLGCCGVPAEWAGDDEKHDEEISRIKTDWEKLGRPILILACPTCRNNFRKYLPEIKTVFLYDMMADWTKSEKIKHDLDKDKVFSIFDPCATNKNDEVRDSIRQICENLGIDVEPMPLQERRTNCCSYGGHGSIADPEFADSVAQKRIEESENPYITYCINCRDAFLERGKETIHILDICFGATPKLSTASKRRENRIEMKERILKEVYGEEMEKKDNPDCEIKLIISDELKKKISGQHLLEHDIINVVAFCERTQRTIYDTEKNTYSGYRKIGRMTHWAEYKKTSEPGVFELVNAYCHRMEIELELIWNGEKIDTDLQ